ncbi:hypothetical protein JTB14_031529 [Gonioctena quinquepunctata]|nr:hypothetical protein JTB14_031529 [Gonioctena quinquepunctata]
MQVLRYFENRMESNTLRHHLTIPNHMDKLKAEGLIGRKVRTALHRDDDNHAVSSESFRTGEVVYHQVHCNNGYQWRSGRIIGKIGNVKNELSLKNFQKILRTHANQLKKSYIGYSEIVVHGSQHEIEISTEPPREAGTSRMKRVPSYFEHFELRMEDVGTT